MSFSEHTPQQEGANLDTRDQSQKQATISELERLCSAGILAFNNHDFDYVGDENRREFRERVAPKFQGRVENYPDQALTFDEMNELWRGYVAAEPETRMNIVAISTDINLNGTAVVYIDVDVTGFQGLKLTRFMEMKWKIMRGKWMYYSCTTMRGHSAEGLR